MAIKTLKKIGKTVACFLVALVAMTVIVPILATIISVVCGIISPFVILGMLVGLLTPNGRELLVKPYHYTIQWFKNWHLFCLCPIVSAVCSTPALFVLSLILHWHLAATIVLGIVVSLAIIAAAIFRTANFYKSISTKEEQGDSLMDTNFKDQIRYRYNDIIGGITNGKNSAEHRKSLNEDENKGDSKRKFLSATKIKTEIKSNGKNNIKRRNSFSKKDIKKSDFYNKFFQKDQNENQDKDNVSCKSLPMVKKHKTK